MADQCCTKAVYDSVAGWWCPDHGDAGQEGGWSDDDFWREDPALLRPDAPVDPL